MVRFEPVTLYVPESVTAWDFATKSQRQLLPELVQDIDEKVSPKLDAAVPKSVQLRVTPFVDKHELGIV
jgi:hypothetical protein